MTAGVKSAKALNERMFSGLPTLRGARVNAMDTRTLDWNWRGKTVRLGADARGTGPKVLLLPALSSISSRREMQALQERLAPRYSTLAVDWPGFGEAARPQVDWTPDAYAAFLAFLLTSVSAHPYAIIAAGHAATYVLKHATSASGPTAGRSTRRQSRSKNGRWPPAMVGSGPRQVGAIRTSRVVGSDAPAACLRT